VLDDLVDRVGERGGALVVRGEAGTGKSALLAAASTRSRKRGIVVLTTVGVQSEAQCPAGATAQHAGAAGRALAGISDGRGDGWRGHGRAGRFTLWDRAGREYHRNLAVPGAS